MLVLTRAPDEKVLIPLPDGSVIKVMLINLVGGKARIGVEAPQHIKIWREEIAPPVLREVVPG